MQSFRSQKKALFINVPTVDRPTLLLNLRTSRLLSKRKLRLVMDNLGHVTDAREIAKALATWKLVTKFQAKMLLLGRKSGFVIGPYCILDELGHGGMGRVYKAMHRTMNRVVALKILSPQTVGTERAQRMFRQEVRAAAQLNHPNIVMAFDANEIAGRHYLAMEIVDGPSLEQYVAKKGALPIGLACEIIFQAAAGLQHAHDKGIVHRDIKPANLLLQQESGSQTLQVKILDFGLSCLRQQGGNAAGRESKPLMGTPDFLSPEQAKDVDSADIRSDLYSLGCTFYFLLTGQVPFPQGNILHKLNRHDREQATPISELRTEVPQNIAAIVRKLMAKNPADRFQTPDELMDVLAPHAAPGEMDWPSARTPSSKSATERGCNKPTVVRDFQVDTEPHAVVSTESSDQESRLEWVETNLRQRRLLRRKVIGVVSGLVAIGLAGLVTWGLTF
jgi:serine/threonine protein kinase